MSELFLTGKKDKDDKISPEREKHAWEEEVEEVIPVTEQSCC
jgi:hypothetical protein